MRALLVFILAIFFGAAARGQVNLYVDSSVTASGAGTSWSAAYKTLAEALTVANNAAGSYTIRVAKGTYYPSGNPATAIRDNTFALTRGGLRVYGGFPNGGGARDVAAHPTVLSGNIGAAGDSLDNSYHVVTLANIPASGDSTVLDGLRIVRGTANGTGYFTLAGHMLNRAFGGGLYAKTVSSKAAITNCWFVGNSASGVGGGLVAETAPVSLTGCVFEANNSSGSGGGAAMLTASPALISGCSFINNSAANSAGALSMGSQSGGTVVGCSFSGNSAKSGGAIHNNPGQSTPPGSLTGCIFTANRGSTEGGAIFHGTTGLSTYPITDCTFTGNKVVFITPQFSYGGGAILAAGTILATDCHFTGNAVAGASIGQGGGAIYQYSAGCNLVSCTFTADTAYEGGAVRSNTGVNATDCIFTGNAAYSKGGAVHTEYVSTFTNCDFVSNTFGITSNVGGGGGISATHGIVITGSRFRGNGSTIPFGSGGALSLQGTSSTSGATRTITSTLFSGNKATTSGGAIILSGTSTTVFRNCTIAGNSAGSGRGIYYQSSQPSIVNSIVWDGASTSIVASGSIPTATVSYSIVEGGYTGTANTATDPQFLAPQPPSAAPTPAGDYSLSGCSPAIDAGLNSGSYVGLVDAAGAPRLYGPTVDRGAYELQAPFGNSILGDTVMCVGGSVQLTGTVPGGVWSSGTPSTASVSATGLVTGLTAGTVVISYTGSGAGSCARTGTRVVSVEAVPVVAPIVGASAVCPNSTILLTNATPGGIWSSSNAGTAAVSTTGAVTGVASGPAIIRYKVSSASGTCADSASKTISVNATSLQTATAAICRGASYLFGGQTLTVPGTYAGVFANAAGCDSTVMLTLSNASPDTTVSRAGAQLTAITSGATYQWLRCENNGTKTVLAGQTGQSFIATTDGQYAVVLTKDGCTDTSACHSIVGLRTAEIVRNVVAVYPNPTTGTVTIATGATGTRSISISDLSGRLLRRTQLTQPSTELDLSGYAPGTYLLRISNDSGMQHSVRVTVIRP